MAAFCTQSAGSWLSDPAGEVPGAAARAGAQLAEPSGGPRAAVRCLLCRWARATLARALAVSDGFSA
jgi:hypothetical protein